MTVKLLGFMKLNVRGFIRGVTANQEEVEKGRQMGWALLGETFHRKGCLS